MGAGVSVIIPAYNAEATIGPTIESVLRQSVKPVEVIVVDDGSKDGTIEQAVRFGSPVRCVRQQHRGVAAARNRGLAEAQGEFVAFLDADDVWLGHKLERQLEVLQREPQVTAVQCSAFLVNNRLEVLDARQCDPAEDTFLDFLLFRNLPGLGSTLLTRRSRLLELGGFDTDLVILEDWDLACRLARTNSLRSLPEFLALYRQHPGNRSRDVGIHIEPGFRSLGRLFADPMLGDDVRRHEAKIWARFFSMLAGGYVQNRQWKEGLSWGWRAMWTSPSVVPYFLGMPLRRLRRSLTARRGISLEPTLNLLRGGRITPRVVPEKMSTGHAAKARPSLRDAC